VDTIYSQDSEGKQMRFVLAIVECINTEAASAQIFAFQINSHFTLTATRHFQLQTTKVNVKHLLFVFTQRFLAKRKSQKKNK